MTEASTVTLFVNGAEHRVAVPNDELLLETLRDRLGVTSARYSCGIGVCGSCTVLLDGRAVSSCLLLTRMADGHRVTTAETAAADALLDQTRREFVRSGAYQCSYCTPAMVLSTYAILRESPRVTARECREMLAGNLCRCGCYPQIFEALDALLSRSGREQNDGKEGDVHEWPPSPDDSYR